MYGGEMGGVLEKYKKFDRFVLNEEKRVSWEK